FSSRRRHTRWPRDWSSDVCSSDLKAARHPGVLAVLTGADLTDIDPYFGQAVRDQPVLAIERVRFAGEPVVAVAAVDALSAEEAQIGRASCRERVEGWGGAAGLEEW